MIIINKIFNDSKFSLEGEEKKCLENCKLINICGFLRVRNLDIMF